VEIEEVRDLGDTIVLVINQGGRGTASGIEVEQYFTWVMTFDHNVCVRWHIYADHAEALEAVNVMKKGPPRSRIFMAVSPIGERQRVPT
jgi:hypothetical protein